MITPNPLLNRPNPQSKIRNPKLRKSAIQNPQSGKSAIRNRGNPQLKQS
ncbi:MAG TPA: hypothetical protein VGQ81_00680 [Acidobacteriota bacterium]|nr:hypothetical protein [Acidobacteriota bacterium]